LINRSRESRRRVWFFDMDNTLHDAYAVFGALNKTFGDYIVEHLNVEPHEADALRLKYWRRYGATLLGLERHHGVDADHFLAQTHRLPELEQRLRAHAAGSAVLARLPGTKYVLTNGPRRYAQRVLSGLGLERYFDDVIAIEDMRMFGALRPKPDKRMFRGLLARLKLRATDCTLVEDTLEHQRAAHALGMRTVWMQRYLKPLPSIAIGVARPAFAKRIRTHRKPAYVCARIQSLQTLRRL
jgi:putative hydrolase of the HAD superfamily